MIRAARYGRFSTDDQDSIADQWRVGGEYIAREGWDLVASYKDEAKSGGDAGRNQYLRLKADARRGLFDVVVVDEVSRLWRDNLEQWECYEEFKYLGIHVIGVRDGVDTRREGHELLFAVRGGMNADFRRFVAKKTHEALRGRAIEGRNAGGLPYGYRTVYGQRYNPITKRHEVAPVRREIDPEKAKWVVWIFERYAQGWSPRSIAIELNRSDPKTGKERAPSPRGSTWSLSAIYGSRRKGTGILNNELYIGRYIWNRSRWIDRPFKVRQQRRLTGAKERRERPQAEWICTDVPELRIVSDELWQAAKARQKAPKEAGGPARGKPRRSVLSGILRCGKCGGAVVAVSQYVYGCAAKKDRGTCPGVYGKRKAVERTVLAAVVDDLLSDEAVKELQAAVREVTRDRQKESRAASDATRTRIAALDREITNLVNAIASYGMSDALRAKLAEAEAERARLAADRTSSSPYAVPDIIPRLLEEYRRELASLPHTMRYESPYAHQTLRKLVGNTILHNEPDGVFVEFDGIYKGLFDAVCGESLNVVAGVGFEPTTFGL